MKILQVNNYGYIRGGSDRVFFEVCDMLEDHGHTVTSLAFGNDIKNHVSQDISIEQKDLTKPNLKHAKSYFYDKEIQEKLRYFLNNHQIDLAHLNIYYGQITTSILKVLKENHIPIIQTLHEYKIVCPTSLMYCNGAICEECSKNKLYALKNRCNRNSLVRSLISVIESWFSEMTGSISAIDHFITVSDFQRNKLIEYGIPTKKMTTIHNFTDIPKNTKCNARGEYFLFYGRIEEIKGLRTLINAAEKLPDVKFLIVGDGEFKTELISIIKQKNLSNVSIRGFATKKEVSKMISKCIATITPSEVYETFGLTNIETMALCKPVICSMIGGMPEVVDDGRDGFLFEPGNEDELVEKIQILHGNPDLAENMGKKGRLKVVQQFTKKIYYKKLVNVYKKVLN